MKIESLFQYLDQYLEITSFPDYSAAHNGLQVGGPPEVYRLGVAVDASEAVINEAVDRKIDLLIVHHGLFWDGRTRIVGPRFRKLRALIQGNIALYGCHLPLDAHTEVGHCAVLCAELGWEIGGRFGAYQGRDIGWWCDVDFKRDALVVHIEKTTKGPVRLIPGGPEQIYRIGVVTGSAADLIPEAAGFGLDALLTGEGPHHTFSESMEFGINTLYAGHYATETWGMKALAAHIEERFDIPWEFIDLPTGF